MVGDECSHGPQLAGTTGSSAGISLPEFPSNFHGNRRSTGPSTGIMPVLVLLEVLVWKGAAGTAGILVRQGAKAGISSVHNLMA